MDEEMIALRWNNHLTTLSQLLYSLREEESLVDVTLACEGKLFQAHKFVLAMCSDFFKEMFTSNPCKHPIVFMKDVRNEDMESLLDFMYKGVVHIPQDALSGLLKTAEGLQIRGLGLFAREAAVCATSTSLEIQTTQQTERTLTTVVADPNDRNMTAGALEPSVLMSPDRKRSLEMDHDPPSFVGLSDTDLDDSTILIHSTHPIKKPKPEEYNIPAATIPELPRISDDLLDIGGGVSISANDYYKFRRTNANRYINDLLRFFFPMEILASSSLTGGECFANKDKGPSNKNQLDPCVIRVITNDAIRNFPNISEKQVRNAIRRKLNTESRMFRSLGKQGPTKRGGARRRSRFLESPRAFVSIEKSDREKDKGPLFGSLITPNVTLEKASTKEVRRNAYASPGQCGQQLSTTDKTTFSLIEKREPDGNYFARQERTPTPRSNDQTQQPSNHQTTSNSATPTPVATPTLPSTVSSPASSDKTFSLIKAELPSAAQYLPQEYTYASVMPPHVSQPYLSHHMAAADPTYLRRLEMSQSAGHPALSYTYSHASLPTSESMDNIHM